MKLSTFALFACALSGCASVHTVNNDNRAVAVYLVPLPLAPASAPPPLVARAACPPYMPPAFEPTPSAPLKAFEQLKPGEEAKQITLLLGYVERLRHHIAQIKRKSQRSHDEHLQHCPGV